MLQKGIGLDFDKALLLLLLLLLLLPLLLMLQWLLMLLPALDFFYSIRNFVFFPSFYLFGRSIMTRSKLFFAFQRGHNSADNGPPQFFASLLGAAASYPKSSPIPNN